MKNFFAAFFVVILFCQSCASDEDTLQKIDQNIDFYIKDALGNNLLIPNKVGSYTAISWNDELAATAVANVSVSRNEIIVDSVYSLNYLAGATREFVKDSSDGSKIYRSLIEVSLIKKLSDTQNSPADLDTLEIQYRSLPSVFEVSKVFYNKQLKFSKITGQPNEVTIVK